MRITNKTHSNKYNSTQNTNKPYTYIYFDHLWRENGRYWRMTRLTNDEQRRRRKNSKQNINKNQTNSPQINKSKTIPIACVSTWIFSVLFLPYWVGRLSLFHTCSDRFSKHFGASPIYPFWRGWAAKQREVGIFRCWSTAWSIWSIQKRPPEHLLGHRGETNTKNVLAMTCNIWFKMDLFSHST